MQSTALRKIIGGGRYDGHKCPGNRSSGLSGCAFALCERTANRHGIPVQLILKHRERPLGGFSNGSQPERP